MVKWTALALILGFLIDLLLGDPDGCTIRSVLSEMVSHCWKKYSGVCFQKPRGEKTAGFFLVLLICIGSGGVPFLLLYLAYHIHTVLGIALETFMCYQMLAVKSLKAESMRVYEALKKPDLPGARTAVSMIVGRDTRSLSAAGVTKAAVETIAENTSDGIIAPLFYMAIGGPALMFLYKGINTMDSMVGYKNEKYLHFGRYAAKLDDIANYIPARISAWLMILASFFAGFDWKNAKKIFLRDRYNHASPNSAQTEAVMAGALDIQLAGNAFYFGKLYEKPTIGDAVREVETEDIKRANRLLYASAALGTLFFALIRMGIFMLL